MSEWQKKARELCPDIPVAENRCDYPTVINMDKMRAAIAEALENAWIDGHKDGLRDQKDLEPV